MSTERRWWRSIWNTTSVEKGCVLVTVALIVAVVWASS